MNLYWRKNNSANWNPARIPPQTPPPRGQNAKTKISRGFAKSFSPENSFGKTESAFRPATLPEYLEGRTPKEKHPFLFQKKFYPRQIRNARSVFFRGCWHTRQCVGLSPSVRFSFASPRTRSVPHHLS